MNVYFDFIYGFQLGFELADQPTKDAMGMNFGLSVDLGIFRLTFASYKDEA